MDERYFDKNALKPYIMRQVVKKGKATLVEYVEVLLAPKELCVKNAPDLSGVKKSDKIRTKQWNKSINEGKDPFWNMIYKNWWDFLKVSYKIHGRVLDIPPFWIRLKNRILNIFK